MGEVRWLLLLAGWACCCCCCCCCCESWWWLRYGPVRRDGRASSPVVGERLRCLESAVGEPRFCAHSRVASVGYQCRRLCEAVASAARSRRPCLPAPLRRKTTWTRCWSRSSSTSSMAVDCHGRTLPMVRVQLHVALYIPPRLPQECDSAACLRACRVACAASSRIDVSAAVAARQCGGTRRETHCATRSDAGPAHRHQNTGQRSWAHGNEPSRCRVSVEVARRCTRSTTASSSWARSSYPHPVVCTDSGRGSRLPGADTCFPAGSP